MEIPLPSPVVRAARAGTRAFARACAPALLALACVGAHANEIAAEVPAAAKTAGEAVLGALRADLARTAPGMRQDISVGSIDPRLGLAPCDAFEATLRPGTAARGRVLVPVRCTGGASWTATVAATVRLFAPALVASRPIAAFGPIRPADLHTAEVEWTRETSGFAVSADQVEERLSTANIEADHAIPLRTLRVVPSFAQGETVKLLWVGEGFQVSTDAVALSSGAPGDSVRVRTEGGRTLSGTARRGRVVEVSF